MPKRPFKIYWEFGRGDGSNPRPASFATAEAAIKTWDELNPETSKPWAEVWGPDPERPGKYKKLRPEPV